MVVPELIVSSIGVEIESIVEFVMVVIVVNTLVSFDAVVDKIRMSIVLDSDASILFDVGVGPKGEVVVSLDESNISISSTSRNLKKIFP